MYTIAAILSAACLIYLSFYIFKHILRRFSNKRLSMSLFSCLKMHDGSLLLNLPGRKDGSLNRKKGNGMRDAAVSKIEFSRLKTIHEIFLSFSEYIHDLLDVNDFAIIITDHDKKQSAILKQNDVGIEMIEIDYDHELLRMMRNTEDTDKADVKQITCEKEPGDSSGLNEEEEKAGSFPEDFPTIISQYKPSEDAGDAAKELRLLNDLFRLAANKYSHNMRLKKLSEIDGLTGLYNHRYFQEQLDQEIKRSQRLQKTLSIIIFDIDHFKSVNDTYGHQRGDLILRELGQMVRGKLRESDIIARYGGEEFAIILPGTQGLAASEISERLRDAVEKHEFTLGDDKPLKITISIGLSDIAACSDKQSLIRAADKALYQAKQSGRNRVVAYHV